MRFVQSTVFIGLMGTFMGFGCQVIAGIEGTAQLTGGSSSSGMAGSGGASSSSSSSTGAGGMGGAGGNAECTTLSDCKSNPCKAAMYCNGGICNWQFIFIYTVIDSQLYGDCRDLVCDGQGNVTFVDTSFESKDLYKWNNPCYVDACNAPLMPMPNDGAACTTSWGNINGVCKAFQCVECTANEDCASSQCSPDGRCIAVTCANTVKDGNETDVDCGGSDCAPCSSSKTCVTDSDCLGKCENMVCAAPSCSDGIRNQDETDIDCGGSCAMAATPTKCSDSMNCLFPSDCQSDSCRLGQCQPPSCLDQIKNQSETAIDCGGGCSPSCP